LPAGSDARRFRESNVDTGALYERTKRAFVALVSELPEDSLLARVPATPLWSVRDVVAHVAGLAADLNAQRFPAPDDDGRQWTDRQVAERRDMKFTTVLDGWEHETPAFADGLRTFGYETGSHFVADLHAHYHDVRGALALPRNTDELVVRVALDHYLNFLDRLLTEARWGTVEVVAGDEAQLLGAHGSHHARLRALPFDVLRSMSGRRSARQIRALDWDGEVDDLLVLLEMSLTGGYSLPDSDLIE